MQASTRPLTLALALLALACQPSDPPAAGSDAPRPQIWVVTTDKAEWRITLDPATPTITAVHLDGQPTSARAITTERRHGKWVWIVGWPLEGFHHTDPRDDGERTYRDRATFIVTPETGRALVLHETRVSRTYSEPDIHDRTVHTLEPTAHTVGRARRLP